MAEQEPGPEYATADLLRLLTRVAAKVDASTGCWVWKGSRSGKGYGSIRIEGKAKTLHRVVYEVLRGPVPGDLTLDHLCRNRSCVNPDHLEPVTSRENTLRGEGVAARNARKTHCIRGHKFTPENTKIRKDNGGRQCRTCNRAWANEKNARLRRAS